MKKLIWLFIFVAVCAVNTKAQRSIGLFFDNYLPANAMLQNPAAPVFSPFTWQVNVVSAGAFAENNLVYSPQETTLRLLGNKGNPVVAFADITSVHAHVYSFIQGPSAFVQLKNFTIGLITDEKYAASVVSGNAPQSLAVFQQIPYNNSVVLPPFKAGYMHWDEIGVNLGTTIYQDDQNNLALGINIKYLGSPDAFYFNNVGSITINRDPVNTMQSSIYNNFAYTSSIGNSTPGSPFNFKFNGKGIGGDIGMLYTIGSDNDDELYTFKFGGSLTDLGLIRYKSESGVYEFYRNAPFSEPTALLQQIGGLSDYLSKGAPVVYDTTPGLARRGSAYTMVLPTAISLTAEAALTHNFYLSALLVQKIVLAINSVQRPNTFAITPSYELKWLAVAVPLVAYDYRQVYFGTSLRIGPLLIGSDNIKSWFIAGKYYGSDIYVGLHINPFVWPFGEYSGSDFRKPFHKRTNCPTFRRRKKHHSI